MKRVLCRAPSGGNQRSSSLNHDKLASLCVKEERPGYDLPGFVQQKIHRRTLLHHGNTSLGDLLGEPADDFDAGQITLVDCPIESLTRERLLVNGSVGIAIEKAAEPALHLLNG